MTPDRENEWFFIAAWQSKAIFYFLLYGVVKSETMHHIIPPDHMFSNYRYKINVEELKW